MTRILKIRTIRSKTIIGVLILILIIQVCSSIFQYFQTRSILMEEFTIGAKNLTEPLFVVLKGRMDVVVDSEAEFIVEDNKTMFQAYVNMVKEKYFDSILNSKKDLGAIQYINVEGDIITRSYKTVSNGNTKIESSDGIDLKSVKNKESEKTMAQYFNIEEQFQNEKLGVAEQDDTYNFFIPFVYRDKFMGGIILSQTKDRINEIKNRIIIISTVLVVIYIAFSSLLVFILVNRMLTKPIRRMIALVREVALGNLDQEMTITSDDEIGDISKAINDLTERLQLTFININKVMEGVERGDLSEVISMELAGDFENLKNGINNSINILGATISEVKVAGDRVDVGSSELSKAATEMSNSTTFEASTLQEIASSIATIEGGIKENSQNSIQAEHTTDEALLLVIKGNKQMEEMMQSMTEINETGQSVAKIIKVIDEIAFQTNLLALNAAVEAARAGKYGKGFAVVAEEVRNLAARSAEAAKSTTELIENSIKQVEKGVNNADKTNAILSEIVSSVKDSNKLVKDIALASQEQSLGISEINAGISQVASIVQKNSAIAEQTAASSEELSGQASRLKMIIKQFRLSQEIPDMLSEDTPLKLIN